MDFSSKCAGKGSQKTKQNDVSYLARTKTASRHESAFRGTITLKPSLQAFWHAGSRLATRKKSHKCTSDTDIKQEKGPKPLATTHECKHMVSKRIFHKLDYVFSLAAMPTVVMQVYTCYVGKHSWRLLVQILPLRVLHWNSQDRAHAET
jgi:hypothetical protein